MPPAQNRPEPQLLPGLAVAGVAAAMAAVALFAWMGATVAAGRLLPFDAGVRKTVHAWASPSLTAFLRGITVFGESYFLVPAGAVAVILLLRAGRRRDARLFVVAALSAELLSEALKLLFHRARPEPYFGIQAPNTYSFPSGHALVPPCFYGVLAAIAASRLSRPAARAAVWTGTAVLVALIGLSRIYLGVHWASDVLAGYAAAAVWGVSLGAALEWRRRRRRPAQQDRDRV